MKNIFGCIVLLIAFHILAKAQPSYTVTDLGNLGYGSSNPTSINNRGEVGGNTQGIAFLYYNGAMHDIGAGSGSSVWSVNDRGEALGSAGSANMYYFIYSGGKIHRLAPANGTIVAMDINDSGTIVGWITGDSTKVNTTFGFIYNNGRYMMLGTLGGNDSLAYAINQRGQIVGAAGTVGQPGTISGPFHAFLYTNGRMHDLGALAPKCSTVATGINDHGQVIGYAFNPAQNGVSQAFFYTAGVLRDMGTLPGYTSIAPSGINNNGEIVGNCYNDTSYASFLYVSPTMYNLNSLLVPNSGWVIYGAAGINDSGQIAALGENNGVAHALLLTPTHRR